MLARDVSVIVQLPRGFERDLVRSGVAPMQLVFNAEDGAAAGILRSYATRIPGNSPYSVRGGRKTDSAYHARNGVGIRE